MVGRKNYKKHSKERERINFRLDAFDDSQRRHFIETLEKVENQSPTLAIKRIINRSMKYKEESKKPEEKPDIDIKESIAIIPNCGYSWNYEGFGIVCLKALKPPVSRKTLENRRLRNLVCELCPALQQIADKAQVESNNKKLMKPVSDNLLSQSKYIPKRDLPLFMKRFNTDSPSRLVSLIYKWKGKHISPEAISNYFRRYPTIREEYKIYSKSGISEKRAERYLS